MGLLSVLSAVLASAHMSEKVYNKKKYHDSQLTGRAWLDELLQGNESHIRDQSGMAKHVFRRLVKVLIKKKLLRDSIHVTIEGQVAIFLYVVVTNLSNQKVAKRFQRSGDTISR